MAKENILRRVRALLEWAAREEDEAERQLAYQRAQEMIDKHRVDLALLDLSGKTEARVPIQYRIELGDRAWRDKKWAMLHHILEHCGVQGRWHAGMRENYAILVGMKEDIETAELLYTLTVMEFLSRIEPGWDSDKSFDANVYALKEAGRKWVEIAHMANAKGGNPRTGKHGSTKDGAWLISAYRRECKRLGVEPTRQTQRHDAFRKSFATSFVSTIMHRLWRMRSSADAARGTSTDNLPAILSVQDRVKNAFYELYPEMHPDALRRRREEAEARQQAIEDAKTPEQKAREEAEWARWLKRNPTRDTHDDAGWRAGHEAANKVDLLGGQNRVENKKALG